MGNDLIVPAHLQENLSLVGVQEGMLVLNAQFGVQSRSCRSQFNKSASLNSLTGRGACEPLPWILFFPLTLPHLEVSALMD